MSEPRNDDQSVPEGGSNESAKPGKDDQELPLDRTQVIIMQQILAHDSGVLAVPEIEARNPDLDSETVQEQLERLFDRGLLTTKDAPDPQGAGSTDFYAVTDQGTDLLKETNLYDEIANWNQVYSQVPVPDELSDFEEMERPMPE